MTKAATYVSIFLFFFLTTSVFAKEISVTISSTNSDGSNKSLGVVTFTDSKYGLLIKPTLQGLPPGLHGFHIHQMAACMDKGMAAGGHLDPANTNQHLGPYNVDGHLGDLPALFVNQQGEANLPTVAPRLTVQQIAGHSVMIHEGGDNYSDSPEKLGGGGARIACGAIKATA